MKKPFSRILVSGAALVGLVFAGSITAGQQPKTMITALI